MFLPLHKKIGTVHHAAAVVLLLLLQLTVDADGRRRKASALRVHQGENVTKGEYPYVMVLIVRVPVEERVIAQRVCTCSLIKPNWVLIAAHCMEEMKRIKINFYNVIYDDLTIPPNETIFRREVRSVFLHPQFVLNSVTDSLRNDIALLSIKTLNQKTLAKISAVDYRSLIGYPVKYVGAGGTYSLQSLLQNEMQKISAIVIEDQTRHLQMGEAVIVKCDPEITLFRSAFPGICMYGKCSIPNQGPIPGDSGGPVFFRGKIIGVASMTGPGTADSSPKAKIKFGPPGFVYTPVSPYLDWIYKVTSCN